MHTGERLFIRRRTRMLEKYVIDKAIGGKWRVLLDDVIEEEDRILDRRNGGERLQNRIVEAGL